MKIKVGEKSKGKRLDVFLVEHLSKHADVGVRETLTRAIVGELILKGVAVNGKLSKKSTKVSSTDLIDVDLSILEEILKEGERNKGIGAVVPEKGGVNIVYEDGDWLVVNKDKGIVMHPGVGNPSGTLANFVVGYLSEKGEYDPSVKRGGVVHRLDKGVSGLVIFAKNRASQLYLKKQFEERRVVKVYRAVVKKIADTDFSKYVSALSKKLRAEAAISDYLQGRGESWQEVEGKIKRDSTDRMRMKFSMGSDSGKYSSLYIKPLSQNEFLISLKTGRMHQIRATLKYLGFVILGDRLYGDSDAQNSGVINLESICLRIRDKKGSLKEWRLI